MVLDYFPLDYLKVNDFFNEAGYFDGTKEKDEKLFELFDARFCRYIDRNGKLCGRKSRTIIADYCCKQHIKYMYKNIYDENKKDNTNNKKYYTKKEIIYKCSWINNRKKPCGRNVKNIGDLCKYHENKKMSSELKNDILFSNPPNMNISYKQLKENNEKRKIIDFTIYRNMNCTEYLSMENFHMKILSDNYIKFKNDKFNFIIKNNYYYYDNNKKKDGNGLLNLIMYIHGLNVYKASLFIENYMKNNNISFSSSFSLSYDLKNNLLSKNKNYKNNLNSLNMKNKKREYKPIPEKNIENLNNIKRYLKEKRKIHKGIVNTMIKKERIYADSNNNVVFTNNDRDFAVIRNIYGKYKSCVGKPDFIIYKNTNEEIKDVNVYMFESPIDALSFMTLYPNIKGIYISINGNMLINKINNLTILKECKILHLCFDNDEAGNEFCNIIIKSKIKEQSLIVIVKPKNKDFNEDLQHVK